MRKQSIFIEGIKLFQATEKQPKSYLPLLISLKLEIKRTDLSVTLSCIWIVVLYRKFLCSNILITTSSVGMLFKTKKKKTISYIEVQYL